MMNPTGFSGLSAQGVLFHLEPLVTAHLLSHKALRIAVSLTRTINQYLLCALTGPWPARPPRERGASITFQTTGEIEENQAPTTISL